METSNIESDEIIKDGSFVVYKMFGTGEVKETIINHIEYPLHKVFLGKRKGDKISLSGKQYEIITIM